MEAGPAILVVLLLTLPTTVVGVQTTALMLEAMLQLLLATMAGELPNVLQVVLFATYGAPGCIPFPFRWVSADYALIDCGFKRVCSEREREKEPW
jgi:hypothetical protein